MFSTLVAAGSAGNEQRISMWEVARHQWDIASAMRNPTQGAALKAFFLARKGKARGFRFKDWDDYQATGEVLVPTGSITCQLIKTYDDGLLEYTREIYKPVSGITMTLNSLPFTDFTLDTTTGLVTFTAPTITDSITAITKAASAVITVGTHSFVVGDFVYISGVNGMTEINGQVGEVTAIAATTITVDINSTSYSTYTSGGTVRKFVQPSDVLTWTGEFDVPVRFDIDQMKMTQVAVGIRSWDSIPIIEDLGSSEEEDA